ncbi:hypothetical protein BCV69DRAFT_62337 [Microstroma glucosiphilum]|uniref:DUF221-domain-containing protein n=1 Tax=Pseudomicrostroma glucosiphilum TaxID=1684307 RepID=A0A316U1P1_9BASI|nr:hypothetical protein BCV69DRAFT_62337 [Pseudomicrostroma glucosiphilum]PWN18768.1 hypothetical protein BCV69DRAFT_62337 [Pseudomicrostroma glucosiphilum]
MTDYADRNFNTEFSGLATTVAIMGGVGGACLLGYETLRQMKRLPRRSMVKFWQNSSREAEPSGKGHSDASRIGTQEDWEMGHLYHARTFHARTPSPPLSRWPLGWAWQALKLDDWFYATHCGMDNVVYVRFLRGMFWWTFLQTVTAAPILLAIDFIYSRGVSTIDMSRASISYLVTYPDPTCTETTDSDCPKLPNEQGRRLLWIQLCALWYITFTWFYTLWWIGKGSLKIRRRLVLGLYDDRRAVLAQRELQRSQAAKTEALHEDRFGRPLREAQGLQISDLEDSSKGWRQRTLLVTNVPASLRGEGNIRRYFEEYLRPDGEKTENQVAAPQGTQVRRETDVENPETTIRRVVGDLEEQTIDNYVEGNAKAGGGSSRTASPTESLPSPVQCVILVRKMGELSAMLNRRADILQQIEAAHIKLAQSVLEKVSQQQRRKRNGKNGTHDDRTRRKSLVSSFFEKNKRSKDESSDDVAPTSDHHTPLDELALRLAKFCKDGGSPYSQSTNGLLDENSQLNSVWEALADVPRRLLDPYQPVTRLSVLFRGQRVPTIDYLLAKLNLLTALIAEMKARPPTDYEPTSTAFVTFRDPRQARMVWRELNSQLVMKVKMAPEVKDIDWDRLMSTSFTGSLIRGFTVNAFFWAFTILWVIPLSIVSTALFSVKSLTTVFPPLRAAFASNPQLESFVSVTLPSLLVSLATMTVPEITFQISRRGQGFMTWSALYDRCLCRYWKFLVCNVLIFFCIGVTTVEAIIQQIISAPGSNQILTNVAFAFPTAAPFFVSYFILALALHSGFELVGFMVPLIVHFTGANKASTPRSRALKTLPRNFNRYYWLPFHTLIMTILFVFTILNPLVIPFGLVYVFFAMVVFKRSFAFVYYRRFMEKDGVVYFVRILRYSSDGLMIAQVVALIFFSVTNQEKAYIALTAVLIPITVLFKVVGTQLWKSQCRAIEDDEANAICGIMPTSSPPHAAEEYEHPPPSSEDVESGKRYMHQQGAPGDARASGRYPINFAPPPTNSKIMTTWQKVHDTFHANGADKPSYIAQRAAEGNPVHHPALAGANLVLRAPFAVAKKAQNDGKHIATVAKLSLGVDKALKAEAVRDNQEHELKSDQNSKTVEGRAQSGKQVMQDCDVVDRKASVKAGTTTMSRSRSGKSIANDESAPFLSGFEALSNHAPVHFDRQMLEGDRNEDGEESNMSIVHQHSVRRRKTMKASATDYSSTPRRNQPSAYADSAPAYGEDRGNDPLSYNNEKAQHPRPSTPEEADQETQDEDWNSEDEAPLVRPHAKVAWDDTPDNSARYNNPFYACEIHNFLWLPRDPLLPLNLCDTVEWHGVALVSSDGGDGIIGEWKEDDEDEQGTFGGPDEDAVTDVSRLGQIEGNEEIILSSHLAKHLETHEEETVEAVSDPAAGLSRKAREDYERALKAQRKASISEASQDGGLLSPGRLVRHSSNISARSHRSPPASIRLQLDAEFNRTQQGSASAVHDTNYNGEPALAQQQQGNRTHWAPDPDNTREQPHNQDHMPPSASMASMTSIGPRRNLTVSSDPRRRNVSGNASVYSAETQSRAVTMQKALQAEVLEEERRRTIKDLVGRKQSKKGSLSRVGGSRRGRGASKEPEDGTSLHGPAADVVQEEDEGLEEAELTRNSTILRRHQRGVDRRLRSGSVLSGTSAEPPRSPSILRAGTRSQHSTSPMPAPALEAGNGLLPTSSGANSRPEPERRSSARSAIRGSLTAGAAENVEMSDLSRPT